MAIFYHMPSLRSNLTGRVSPTPTILNENKPRWYIASIRIFARASDSPTRPSMGSHHRGPYTSRHLGRHIGLVATCSQTFNPSHVLDAAPTVVLRRAVTRHLEQPCWPLSSRLVSSERPPCGIAGVLESYCSSRLLRSSHLRLQRLMGSRRQLRSGNQQEHAGASMLSPRPN